MPLKVTDDLQHRDGGRPPGMFSFVCCPAGSTVHVDVRRVYVRTTLARDAAAVIEEAFERKEVNIRGREFWRERQTGGVMCRGVYLLRKKKESC